MTLINTKDRSINDEEVEAFTEFLMKFMNRHGAPDLSIGDISIASQQKAYYDVTTVKGKGNETDSYVSVKVARSLTSQSTSRLRKGSQRRLRTLPAVEFQLDVGVSSSSVPKSQFAARSLEVITKNKIEFIELIRETGEDLPYFKNVNDVLMSYSVPETTASLTPPDEPGESGGSNIGGEFYLSAYTCTRTHICPLILSLIALITDQLLLEPSLLLHYWLWGVEASFTIKSRKEPKLPRGKLRGELLPRDPN